MGTQREVTLIHLCVGAKQFGCAGYAKVRPRMAGTPFRVHVNFAVRDPVAFWSGAMGTSSPY